MRICNQAGLRIIKECEGCKLTAYQDSVGVWTIGYGHTRTAQKGQTISQEDAERLLREDLREVEKSLDKLLPSTCTDNQFSALCSFAFNLGVGALSKSTLLKRLRDGDIQGASNEFSRWVNAGGKPLPGLITRRERERQLFLT